MNRILKWILISIGMIVGGYIIYMIVVVNILIFTIGGDEFSSKKELINNLNVKKNEIYLLKKTFNELVPSNYSVYISFNNSKSIDLWVSYLNDTTKNFNTYLFQQWDINPYNYKPEAPTHIDSTEYAPKTKSLDLVKQKLNWTDNTFKLIESYLRSANCISIKSGNPTTIGFARRGSGGYSFKMFDDPMSDSLKQIYNDGCIYIVYNDTLVLEWESGVLGVQCFPDK